MALSHAEAEDIANALTRTVGIALANATSLDGEDLTALSRCHQLAAVLQGVAA